MIHAKGTIRASRVRWHIRRETWGTTVVLHARAHQLRPPQSSAPQFAGADLDSSTSLTLLETQSSALFVRKVSIAKVAVQASLPHARRARSIRVLFLQGRLT